MSAQHFLTISGALAAMTGDVERGFAQVEEGLSRIRATGDHAGVIVGTVMRAEATLIIGDYEGTLEMVDRARALIGRYRAKWEALDVVDHLEARSRLCLAERRSDPSERARALRAIRAPLRRMYRLSRHKRPPYLPWAMLDAATFERLSGRLRGRLYERAYRVAQAQGAKYARAEILAECARAGAPLFGWNARELAERALVLYRECGAHRGLEEARALVVRLGGDPEKAE
jgi:hypothetical protein